MGEVERRRILNHKENDEGLVRVMLSEMEDAAIR